MKTTITTILILLATATTTAPQVDEWGNEVFMTLHVVTCVWLDDYGLMACE